MGLLDTKQRKAISKSKFAEPGARKFPIEDRAHAANAKARATQMVDKGQMSESMAAMIKAKANKVLKK